MRDTEVSRFTGVCFAGKKEKTDNVLRNLHAPFADLAQSLGVKARLDLLLPFALLRPPHLVPSARHLELGRGVLFRIRCGEALVERGKVRLAERFGVARGQDRVRDELLLVQLGDGAVGHESLSESASRIPGPHGQAHGSRKVFDLVVHHRRGESGLVELVVTATTIHNQILREDQLYSIGLARENPLRSDRPSRSY